MSTFDKVYVRADDDPRKPLSARAVIFFKDAARNAESVETDASGALRFDDWSTVREMVVSPSGGYWKEHVQLPAVGLIIKCKKIDSRLEGWWSRYGRSDRPVAYSVGIIDYVSPSLRNDPRFKIYDRYPGNHGSPDSHGESVAAVILRICDGFGAVGDEKCSQKSIHLFNIASPLSDAEGYEVATSSDLVQGIFHLVNNTDVSIINISQGIYDETSCPDVDAAIYFAKLNGVLCVAAAGNKSRKHVTVPASNEDVIAVGGIGRMQLAPAGTFARYYQTSAEREALVATEWFACPMSSYQGGVNVVAPSSGIILTSADGYATEVEGTSYACPTVVATMINEMSNRERNPASGRVWEFSDLKMLVRSICRNVGLSPDRQGYGMPVCEVTC